uniref:anti-sigma-I factor RsgI family protein n=1 Tax=Paraclostridium bifermentans TaxID=1490 RepID=UPI00359C3113
MEVKDTYSIVMKDDATMARIKNKEDIKEGDTIIFLEDDIYNEEVKNIKSFNRYITPFIAAAAILIMIIIPMTSKPSTYAVVSLDINPSIQLNIGKNKEILKATGMNEDARRLELDKVDGMDLDDGLKEIKNILEKANYNLQGDSMLVGFAQVKDSKNSKYDKEIKNAIDKNFEGMDIVYLDANKKDLEEANKKGISLGRYLAEIKIGNKLDYNIEKISVEKIFTLMNGEDETDKEKEVESEIKTDSSDDIDVDYYQNQENKLENDINPIEVEGSRSETNENNGNHYGQDESFQNNGNHYGQDESFENNGNHYGQNGNPGNNGNNNNQVGNQVNNGNHNGYDDIDDNKNPGDTDEDKDDDKIDIDDNKNPGDTDEDKDDDETDIDDNKNPGDTDEDKDDDKTDIDDNKNPGDIDEDKDDDKTDIDDNKNPGDIDEDKDDETDIGDNKNPGDIDEDKDDDKTDIDGNTNPGGTDEDKDDNNHDHCGCDGDNKGDVIIVIVPKK